MANSQRCDYFLTSRAKTVIDRLKKIKKLSVDTTNITSSSVQKWDTRIQRTYIQ